MLNELHFLSHIQTVYLVNEIARCVHFLSLIFNQLIMWYLKTLILLFCIIIPTIDVAIQWYSELKL